MVDAGMRAGQSILSAPAPKILKIFPWAGPAGPAIFLWLAIAGLETLVRAPRATVFTVARLLTGAAVTLALAVRGFACRAFVDIVFVLVRVHARARSFPVPA